MRYWRSYSILSTGCPLLTTCTLTNGLTLLDIFFTGESDVPCYVTAVGVSASIGSGDSIWSSFLESNVFPTLKLPPSSPVSAADSFLESNVVPYSSVPLLFLLFLTDLVLAASDFPSLAFFFFLSLSVLRDDFLSVFCLLLSSDFFFAAGVDEGSGYLSSSFDSAAFASGFSTVGFFSLADVFCLVRV